MTKFKGYARENGDVGIRNHVLVIPMVVCANSVVEELGRKFPEVVTIPHVYGCTFDYFNNKEVTNIFIGLGCNPNVAGVLLISLGCETIDLHEVQEGIAKSNKPVETIVIQELGGTIKAVEQGVKAVEELIEKASSYKLKEASISDLTIGTECGASDSYSGLSANPVIGYVCDKFVDLGGTVILTEVTEFIGAEEILAEQCVNSEAARELLEIVAETEKYLAQAGKEELLFDISPGNLAGGLTTIEEKSLGCIKKGGTRQIQEIVKYGHKPTAKGLIVMDAPGHDIESMTAMAAGGAHLIYFTTGRGTPVGSPVTPVVKVASNSEIYEKMKDNMDINCGEIIEGQKSISQVGEDVFQYTMSVIKGSKTSSERLRCHEFAIRRKGVQSCIF